MSDATGLWMACEQELRTRLGNSVWQAWFAGVRPESLTDDEVVLAAPSSVVLHRLEDRFAADLRATMEAVGAGDLGIRFIVRTEDGSSDTADDEDDPEHDGANPIMDLAQRVEEAEAQRRARDRGHLPRPGRLLADDDPDRSTAGATAENHANGAKAKNKGKDGDDGADPSMLNDKYTFDQFVIGESNRFTHAACMAVAENPARSYNPLFIYGDAGLGKTHLIQAIGNYVRANFPLKQVRYISTEQFLSDFVDSIRGGSQSTFKRRYRDCDVLLVDDIQFLEGAKETQNEFFHTFNHLYGLNSQIVITSDRHPSALATLESRLRTRFLAGLLTDVQPPELETRLAILRRKAEDVRVHCPDDVLDLIASNVKHNIRELEGALTRVTAYASLEGVALTKELAEEVLRDLLSATPRMPTTPEIIEAVAAEFNVPLEELIGPSRRKNLVDARQIAMYLCRSLTEDSYPVIARAFGGRDHSTVIYAVDKIAKLMGERTMYFAKVNGLTQRLKQEHQ